MKDESGFVTIDDYYEGIEISEEIKQALSKVPDKEVEILQAIGIKTADAVGKGYQEAMQYPSLNVRHVETAWKGPGLKTIIPEYVTAHIDVRLVVETDALEQINKIKKHVEKQGYLVLDRDPTDEERASYDKIVKFTHNNGMNAFRTDMNAPFGKMLINTMEMAFGQAPVSIRTMGGTVPIIPAINTLGIPAIIVPMVNMDNNQHNPNENLRIGNMSQGIRMCIEILTMQVN
jgi:acetylornithine deacetylase/succinyl-diaminopimelate desuccinylase-like protein